MNTPDDRLRSRINELEQRNDVMESLVRKLWDDAASGITIKLTPDERMLFDELIAPEKRGTQ